MIRTLALAAAAAALPAAPAMAEIVQATPAGFEVSNSVTVTAPLERAWPTVVAPRLWWNKEHTYSEDSANLTLDERPGGCFCEKLPDKGGVEHMRVAYIQPPRMIRMIGGLGPLQAEGATGTLSITLTKEVDGTRIVMTYVAGGYIRAGGDKLAPTVDRVLALQLAGLKAAIDGAAPPPAAKPAPAAARKPRIEAEPLADVGATISTLDSEDRSAAPASDASAPAEPRPTEPRPTEPRPAETAINPESPR